MKQHQHGRKTTICVQHRDVAHRPQGTCGRGEGVDAARRVREALQKEQVWPADRNLNFPAKAPRPRTFPAEELGASGRPRCCSGEKGSQTQHLKLTQMSLPRFPASEGHAAKAALGWAVSGYWRSTSACPGAGRFSSRGCGDWTCFLPSCWRSFLSSGGSQHPWPQPPPSSESAAGGSSRRRPLTAPPAVPLASSQKKVLCF